ncbi:hypothetical protein RvY_02078 [Ramazzottius varieornatus]|uniref:Receptor ligand binding region domain-containing protein n=1 Tax=Ramazzottius varieornatus TaxID=947166 RepID=A0A1D1UIK1_RAMVA|nr:hypothetical protein RvY_02078 [Ramazzottius varieornatus]
MSPFPRRTSRLLICLNFLCAMVQSVHINIVILILGEDPSFGYYATAPMYDIAFERAARMYPSLFPNTTRHVLHQKNVRDCASAAANMVDVAGKMMDLVDRQEGLTILMSPGCSAEAMVLGDFARELNVLLLASTSADLAFMNKQRFPTFIALGPVGRGASVPALKAFLEHYDLTTFTVFCETTANYLNVASFVSLVCRAIRSLVMTSKQFTVYLQEIDSVRKPDYKNMLLRAKNSSRGILVDLL